MFLNSVQLVAEEMGWIAKVILVYCKGVQTWSHMIRQAMISYDMIWYDMTRCDMIWYDMISYNMIRYDKIW